MTLDFSNKPCPIPVIETKKALFAASAGTQMRIIVDNDAAKENIKRLLASCAQEYELDGYIFSLQRAAALTQVASQNAQNAECVLFKSGKIGEGELGAMLMGGFLCALAERKNLRKVILINDAIFAACDENHHAFSALCALSKKGVEVICCANCLNYFAQHPKIGAAGDAASIIDALFSHNTLSL